MVFLEYIKDFFKNKLNLAIAIIILINLVFLIIGRFVGIFNVFAVFIFAIICVLIAIRLFIGSKPKKNNYAMFFDEDEEKFKKKNKTLIFVGIIFLVFGVIIVYAAFRYLL